MASDQWFVGRNGQQLGPYRFEALRELAARQKLQPSDLVWTEGMPDWKRADAVEALPLSSASAEPTAAASHPQAASSAANAPQRTNVVPEAAVPSNRLNYFARHWRGELSLPVSYWVNGVLINGGLVLAITVVGISGFIDHLGAVGSGSWTLGVLALTTVASLWLSVGIWRSAERHVSRGGRSGWATLAKAAVVLGLLRLAVYCEQQVPTAEQSIGLMFGSDPMPVSQLHVVDHAKEVEIAGGMSFGTADKLKMILDATPSIRTVQLNNVGGWIAEGDRVGQLIRARGLSTFTARECDSACLLAFLGGNQRYLGSKGRLGFHEASVAGVGGEVAKEGTDRIRQVFLENGIPASFIDRALTTPAASMWYPTASELLGAHVITAVVDERDYALTGVSGWRDRAKLEADFAATPIFAALERAEPKTYENLKDTYVSGIQEGSPQAEMTAKIHNVVTGTILPKYLRIGPDAALVAYWQSQLTEMRELRAIDPKYCVAFILPSSGADTGKLPSLFSKETQAADLRSLANLLDAASLAPAAIPPQAAVQSALRAVALRTEQRIPGALRVVENPNPSTQRPKMLCDAELTFYDEIISLPASQAGPLLRFLLASSDGSAPQTSGAKPPEVE